MSVATRMSNSVDEECGRRVPANRGRRYPPEPLTDNEVRQLIGAVKGKGPIAVRNRALIGVLVGAGLRCAEALDLMPRDVENDSLRVRHGKGDKARVVGLRPEAGPLLWAWMVMRERLGLDRRTPVFCSIANGAGGVGVRQPGNRLDSSYVRRLLPKLAARAGIEKRVTPHGLRHSFASELIARDVPLNVLSAALGHSSVATTDIYIQRLAPRHQLAALHRAWSIQRDGVGQRDHATNQKRDKFEEASAESWHALEKREPPTMGLSDRDLISALLARLITPTPVRPEMFAFEVSRSPIQGIPYPAPDTPRPEGF
jgi:site-specific recombinase XerD